MLVRPPRYTRSRSSAASDVCKRQVQCTVGATAFGLPAIVAHRCGDDLRRVWFGSAWVAIERGDFHVLFILGAGDVAVGLAELAGFLRVALCLLLLGLLDGGSHHLEKRGSETGKRLLNDLTANTTDGEATGWLIRLALSQNSYGHSVKDFIFKKHCPRTGLRIGPPGSLARH